MSLHVTLKKTVFVFVGLCLLGGLCLCAQFAFDLIKPAREGQKDQFFLVPEGSTLRQVALNLEVEGFLSRPGPFLLWGRLKGYSKSIKAGEYRLNSSMSPLQILRTLKMGVVATHAVTIPEGFTSEQIAALMEGKGLVQRQEFLSLARDPEFAQRCGISAPALEGYLYPDTYRFSRGLSVVTLVNTMVRRFQEMVEPLMGSVENSGMSLGEVLTLASIVEKETGCARERPLIASVFLNRLKRGMRLESDPTVIYGLKDFDGNLTRKDLAQETAYNTYVIKGLPPGPIANPGLAAIKAVLSPATADFLYFVSKNDGTHHFSKTLREHNRAVRIYQKRRRHGHKTGAPPSSG
jgi:UPF0755 protein